MEGRLGVYQQHKGYDTSVYLLLSPSMLPDSAIIALPLSSVSVLADGEVSEAGGGGGVGWG